MNLPASLRFKDNVYVAIAKYLLLAMAGYTLCRVAFFVFNTPFFQGMTFGRFATIMTGGLRFDLSAVLYSNSLLMFLLVLPFKFRFTPQYHSIVKWLFLIVNAVALATNIADAMYYPFALRRTTFSVFSQFSNEQNGFALFFRFILDYWYAVLIWIALVALLYFGQKRIRWSGPQIKNDLAFYPIGLVALGVITYLTIGGMRGGFAHSTRPITLSNAAEYASDPKDINLVLNTPFALMRTSTQTIIHKKDYFQDELELNSVFDPVTQPDSSTLRAKNVVVIILESFSKEFIGAYHRNTTISNYKGYTPFIDSLIGVGTTFQFGIANGRKSIDAMPSVISSIPSIEVPYVLSHYSGNTINSLPSLLKPKGYYTAFFHGAPNGSMGFQAFANLCGFDKYYGRTEYEYETDSDDYDGIWGIWDEPFFQYFGKKITTFKEPFYATIFSVSSHHPYNLPKGDEDRFKGGDLPIYRTIEYTDNALKEFFAYASKQSWFDNTLFVITADHASAEFAYPEYNTTLGYLSIPIIFYKRGQPASFTNDVVQQLDIMPTVLSAVGYDQPYISFGRNAMGEKTPIAFNYIDDLYQLFRGNYLLRFDGQKSVALIDYKNDLLMSQNLVADLPDTVRSMERTLKAYIQQYDNRMVDDNLTSEGPQVLRKAELRKKVKEDRSKKTEDRRLPD